MKLSLITSEKKILNFEGNKIYLLTMLKERKNKNDRAYMVDTDGVPRLHAEYNSVFKDISTL